MLTNCQKGFTLLELLIVIAIMGLLGTVSVSGYRGLKKGMEERGVMQNVDRFVRTAYQRAVIDRVPTAIYYWNETISDENAQNNLNAKLVVVGRAVAVRRMGRLSLGQAPYLIDEFGDLANERPDMSEDDGDTADSQVNDDDLGRYLYPIGDKSFHRSVVFSYPIKPPTGLANDWVQTDTGWKAREFPMYAYKLKDARGVDWKTGDSYGFEFAELTLPKNYIFDSGYETSTSKAEENGKVIIYRPSGTIEGGDISVLGLQLDASGAVSFKRIGSSGNPKSKGS